MKKILGLFSIAALAFACHSDPRETPGFEPAQLVEEDGSPRAADMGEPIRKVLAREADNIVHQMPDELTTRIPLNQKDSTYYEITYNFSDDGLYIIDMELYPKDSADGQIVYEQFREYFVQRFGTARPEGESLMWRTLPVQGNPIEITMTDEGLVRQRPTLSIRFNETDGH